MNSKGKQSTRTENWLRPKDKDMLEKNYTEKLHKLYISDFIELYKLFKDRFPLRRLVANPLREEHNKANATHNASSEVTLEEFTNDVFIPSQFEYMHYVGNTSLAQPYAPETASILFSIATSFLYLPQWYELSGAATEATSNNNNNNNMYSVDAHVRPFALFTLYCLYSTQPALSTVQPYAHPTPVVLAASVAENLLTLATMNSHGGGDGDDSMTQSSSFPFAMLLAEKQCLCALYKHGGLQVAPGVQHMQREIKYVLESAEQAGVPLFVLRAVYDTSYHQRTTREKENEKEKEKADHVMNVGSHQHEDGRLTIPFSPERYSQVYKEKGKRKGFYTTRLDVAQKDEARLQLLTDRSNNKKKKNSSSSSSSNKKSKGEVNNLEGDEEEAHEEEDDGSDGGGEGTQRGATQKQRQNEKKRAENEEDENNKVRLMAEPLNVENCVGAEELQQVKSQSALSASVSERYIYSSLLNLHPPSNATMATTTTTTTGGGGSARDFGKKARIDIMRKGINLTAFATASLPSSSPAASSSSVAAAIASAGPAASTRPWQDSLSLAEGREQIKKLKEQYDALKEKAAFR